MKKFLLLSIVVTLSGCATLAPDTPRTLVVNTTPPGAYCVLESEGRIIGQIAKTPGSITVQKPAQDIHVECNKKGYHTARFTGTMVQQIEYERASPWDSEHISTMNIELIK